MNRINANFMKLNLMHKQPKIDKEKKLKDACKDFEAFFLNIVFDEMRKSMPKNTLFPETNEKKIFNYMFFSALTKEGVKNQTIGIADILFNYLKKFI